MCVWKREFVFVLVSVFDVLFISILLVVRFYCVDDRVEADV